MAIDIHGHITSPVLLERFPMPPSLGDIDGMIEKKAAAGITTTIVGSPVGAGTMIRVPGMDNYRQPLDQLAAFHEWVAEQVRARPGRLKAYAYTNPLGGEEIIEAAARLVKQEEFVGLIVNSSINGEFLDSPRADTFFAMAAESGVPVLIHPPAEPAGAGRLTDLRLVEHVARPGDVAVGVAAIVFAGWLERYPQLRIIAATASGGLSLLVEKLEIAYRMPRHFGRTSDNVEPRLTAERPPSESLRRVYVDTATPSESALLAAIRAFGPDNVMLGTDTPPMNAPPGRALAAVDRLDLPSEHRAGILGGNAAALFNIREPVLGARP